MNIIGLDEYARYKNNHRFLVVGLGFSEPEDLHFVVNEINAAIDGRDGQKRALIVAKAEWELRFIDLDEDAGEWID